MMRINVKNLRGFFAVAFHGGFSAAASELHISQPALTRQVQDLESTYNVQLLDRSTRRVSLTPLGQTLFRRLTDVFSELDHIEHLLKNENRREMMTFSVSHPKLLEFINAGHSLFPKVRLNFEIMPSGDVYRGLSERRCDFGFLTLPEENHAFETLNLGHFPIVAVVGKSHPLFAQKTLRLEDLADQSLIIGSSRASTRWNFDRIVKNYGFHPKSIRVNDVLGECIYMAKAGLGIAIIGGDGEFEVNDECVRFFDESDMSQPLYFACLPQGQRPEIANHLFHLAGRIFQCDSVI